MKIYGTPGNEPQRRVVEPRNPMLDVLHETFIPGDEKQRGQSTTHWLIGREMHKAFEGDRFALHASVKRAARREMKLMREGRYQGQILYETRNLDYEFVGDVAVMLGIAAPCDAPPDEERDWFERNQRYQLKKWPIQAARERGSLSDEDLANIRIWQENHCPQWRYKTVWTEHLSDLPEKYREVIEKPKGRPPGSKNKPKASIHPYDMKVRYPVNGELKLMRVSQALILCARHFAALHPDDTLIAPLLLDIEEKMDAIREKRRATDFEPIRLENDDLMLAPLPVACLETALIVMGAAAVLYPRRPYARAVLEPWLVQAALDRMNDRRLTRSEQMRVVNRTRHPSKVEWPDWWDEDLRVKRGPGRAPS